MAADRKQRPAVYRPEQKDPPLAETLSTRVIELTDVRKRFGAREAVAGVTLSVTEPECFGLLGPNGAGKTTLMRMLYGSTPLTGGSVRVLQRDVTDARNARIIRSLTGIVSQADNLDPDLPVRESLIVHAYYYGIGRKAGAARADELLEWVRLSDRAKETVSDLSGGLRRRLTLARALIHKPRLLILDEPTTGLDPQARHMLWDKVREMKDRFVTVLLSTHDMDEAQALCDRLAVMDQGKVVAMGAPRELVHRHLAPHCVAIRPKGQVSLAALASLKRHSVRTERRDAEVLCFTNDPRALLAAASKLPHEQIRERESDLEDLFLALTGKELSADLGDGE